MKKFCILAIFAFFFWGCGPTQQGERVQEEMGQENPILFRSMSDDFLGFYEMKVDSLTMLVQDNDRFYHYYVYDSSDFIAEGFYDLSSDKDSVCCYDCSKQWSKCAIIIFTADGAEISKIQFILSRTEDGIDLTDCAVSDAEGHEYWSCSEDADSIIEHATSHVIFPIFEAYLDYLPNE